MQAAMLRMELALILAVLYQLWLNQTSKID
jgi:hypothetical protein